MTTQETVEEYSREELEEMLMKMSDASNTFYRLAASTGCHALIEFTGLMNEYIKMCKSALAQNIDFTKANVHGSEAVPMLVHEAHYLAEKFECIFGPTFAARPDLARRFVEDAFAGYTLKAIKDDDDDGEKVD